MSAIKRLLSGHHKLHKHNSLPQPPSTDLRIDYLDLERVNRHERCRSKPTTPISASTPTYKTGVAISGSPISQSPTSSSSSVKSNPHHGRSRSRVRAKHERAKSLDVRATKSRLESLERATHRQDSYNSDPLKGNYGQLPLNMSQEGIDCPSDSFESLSGQSEGASIRFRARVHHVRPVGSHIMFLILRQGISTVQAVVSEEEGTVSRNMVRWAGNLTRETIVYVQGKIQKPGAGQPEVKHTTIHEVEITVEKLHVITAPAASLPFQVEDAGRSLAELTRPDAHYPRIGQTTRLTNRVVDLRTPVSHSIFRARAGIANLFRTFLDSQGFTEIQSPKLQPAATESGSAVFKVDYFHRPAFLAQSPQLAKQMAIAADMERVYEIGPVFRAENSNTHRHLTEFTGLDLEMAFENNYHEVMDVIDKMFLFIFKGIQNNYKKEIETIKTQYPHEDLLFLDETLKLKFSEGIQMLIDAGYKEDDGSDPSPLKDLTTKAEQTLGGLVREKYHTDYYILDKFPASARPFYTMPDPENPLLSNSYDIFIRGEEVLSGSQRIHDASLLEKKMREANIDPETMTDYLNGFKWGCPPHGGGGVGLDRVVMLMLKLGDIRWASLIPRDPRSFPQKGQPVPEATMVAAQNLLLHGPESSTFSASTKHIDGELPPLENLIARYGDATNTSWIDPAWTVWRDHKTGAAVGYIPKSGFAVTFGNPLCEPKQIPVVVRAYLNFLSHEKLKPVWCCVDADTEKVLANDFGWSALTAVAEERINPTEADPEKQDKNLRKKVHRAEKSGVKLTDVEGLVDPETKKEIDERVEDWKQGRKGTQIHLTAVRPWDDEVHRKYFYARDAKGKICAMVVLAQLSASHGFQIKWALEFPGAPLGAIEYILTHVIKKMGEVGVRSATFGAGAASELHRVDNIGGFKVVTLEKAYNGLSSTFHLGNKGDFRSKFGTQQDPLYICYPKGGLGVKGIEAIMKMLQSPK